MPPLPVSGVPRALDAVLAKGLAKSPEDRYRTAGELAGACLEAVPERAEDAEQSDQTVRAMPIPVPTAVMPPASAAPTRLGPLAIRLSPPAVRALAVAAAVLVGAGGLLVTVRALQPPPSPTAVLGGLPAPARGAVGSPVQVAGLRLTVLGIDVAANPPSSLRVPAGSRFVAVRVRYQGGARPATMSPYDWVLTDASGGVHGAVVEGLGGALPERQLRSGEVVEGEIGFVLPRGAQGLVLAFDAELGDGSVQVPLS
jgi:hypothetical protein